MTVYINAGDVRTDRLSFVMFLSPSTTQRYIFTWPGYYSWCVFCPQVPPRGTLSHSQVTVRVVSVPKYLREVLYYMARLPFVMFLSTSTTKRYIIIWPACHSWCFCPQVPSTCTSSHVPVTIHNVSVLKSSFVTSHFLLAKWNFSSALHFPPPTVWAHRL